MALLPFSFSLCLIIAIIAGSITPSGSSPPPSPSGPPDRSINNVFKWKTISYRPTDKSDKDLIGGFPYYLRNNIIPTAIAYHEKTGMMYIAAPRIKPGVIATLNSLDLYETYHLLSPIWEPYPTDKMNELQPSHFPDDPSEYAEGDDCDEEWKKGPGFCRGIYENDEDHIPDQYLPEELLAADASDSTERGHHRHRNKRSDNDSARIKIRISPSFLWPGEDSDYAAESTEAEYYDTDDDSDDGDTLRIKFRTVRQLKSLISVNSLLVDRCDRLWFIDTGVLDYLNYNGSNLQPPITVQRPAIWVVDISKKDVFLVQRRYVFSKRVVATATGLKGFAVDVPGSCETTGVAYIANAQDNRIVVYDMERETSWYFHDRSMMPDPGPASRLYFGSVQVDLSLGISALALGGVDGDRERSVFYSPYSSRELFAVSTEHLGRQYFQRLPEEAFEFVGGRGPYSQTETMAFDSGTGVLYFAEVQTRAIRCWNVRKRLQRSHIGRVYENANMAYPAHLSIDSSGNLWVLNNNFPMFLEGGFDHDTFNMHIYRIVLKDVIKGTVCE